MASPQKKMESTSGFVNGNRFIFHKSFVAAKKGKKNNNDISEMSGRRGEEGEEEEGEEEEESRDAAVFISVSKDARLYRFLHFLLLLSLALSSSSFLPRPRFSRLSTLSLNPYFVNSPFSSYL